MEYNGILKDIYDSGKPPGLPIESPHCAKRMRGPTIGHRDKDIGEQGLWLGEPGGKWGGSSFFPPNSNQSLFPILIYRMPIDYQWLTNGLPMPIALG